MSDENFSFMTLARARDVYWLSTNHRPMGELYDNGFLTQSRLEWGKQYAYDPVIRAACDCLLKLKIHDLQTHAESCRMPRNLDEARVVVWPYSQRTGKPGWAIGRLWDARIIGKQDLAYAIENARDDQVRMAAHIVLCNSLEIETAKLAAPKGALKVTAPSTNFMERSREFLSMCKGMWVGGFLVVVPILLVTDVAWMIYKHSLGVMWHFICATKGIGVAVMAVFIILVLLVGQFIFRHTLEKKIDNYDLQIADHRKGQDGEDKVINVMRESLDGTSHVFRNLKLPGQESDMDAVLVSPQGVFIFEIKNWTGKYQNDGDDWTCLMGKKWKKMKMSPTVQAKRNAALLANFLEPIFYHNNEKKWVRPIGIGRAHV